MKHTAKNIKKSINFLHEHFGSHTNAAIALGYEPRAYRRIRKDINNGESISYKTEQYIILKAGEFGIKH